MVCLVYLVIFFLFVILLSISMIICSRKPQRTVIPTNWPILGMMPGVLVNAHRINDYVTELLIQSSGTFMLKGPWFGNMDLMLTTDPLDVHHILSKHFNNYPRGDKFKKIFDILGDGIVNSDGKLWEMNRTINFSIFKHAGFQTMMETVFWDKVENRLLPMLQSICERGIEIDLQDIFQRFAFDSICKILFDNDPESLSLDFPYVPCLKALVDGEEALLLRHITPPWLWKLQQALRVGKEKKLSDAWINLDEFIYKYLADKQKEYNNMNPDAETFIFFTAIMKELKYHIGTSMDSTKFLRDTLLNLMSAGKDSIASALSWFFYLIAINPTVQDKILEEIHTHLEVNACKRWNMKDLEKMVYLHSAICESLRLYPSIPFNNRSPSQPDILPSGNKVDQNTNIIMCLYSMGRMKSIWGEDCMEFKPERWISNSGGIKHEPSYKFSAFNAGPRACLGKNMALCELKIVATTIIYHYHTQLVEGHRVLPASSMVLRMKHGLKVRLNKRSEGQTCTYLE